MQPKFSLLVAALLVVLTVPGSTANAGDIEVPKEKQTKLQKYLTAGKAYDVVQADHRKVLFVDIRTRSEVAYVGMTSKVDGQVPYVQISEFWEWDDKNGRFKLEPNPNFGQDIERLLKAKGLSKNDKIILMCRSGDRSARAANLLADLGYTDVWTVIDGFEGDLSEEGRRNVNGCKNAGLPWTYQLDKSKIYIPSR